MLVRPSRSTSTISRMRGSVPGLVATLACLASSAFAPIVRMTCLASNVVARLAQLGDLALDHLGAGPRRLEFAGLDQVRALDALGEAEMVVDHRPPRHARIGIDQDGLQPGAGGESGGAGPSRPAAHDRDVVHPKTPPGLC
jgi:hypothetical protein